MSALHRLKAYFGMVPAEELDAAGLDAAGLDTAQLDDYRPPYRSGYPNQDGSQGYDPQDYDDPQCGSGFDRATANALTANTSRNRDYGDGFATRAGRHASPRMHSARSLAWAHSPVWATELHGAEPRTDPWATEAPLHGSLAIDTATLNTRPTAHQPRVTPVSRTGPLGEDSAPVAPRVAPHIVTLHPYSYNEARPIGERYREGNPVIMNLTAMEDRDAKRLVDFAAGLAFALRGSIDKITNKVFLLSPPNVDVSAEDRRRIAEGHSFN